MRQSSVEQDSPAYSEWDRLFDEFAAAIAEIIALQGEPVHASRSPDRKANRLAILLKRAEERKREKKDALLSYIKTMPVVKEQMVRHARRTDDQRFL